MAAPLAPQQARSRATLDRLLDATGALLAEKHFDQASVAEIVRRAETSVGAFYGRFQDKESLLDCFDEKFFELATSFSGITASLSTIRARGSRSPTRPAPTQFLLRHPRLSVPYGSRTRQNH